MDAGILIARLILGLAIAAHGAQKLFEWFGGHGVKGTAGFFEGLGLAVVNVAMRRVAPAPLRTHG